MALTRGFIRNAVTTPLDARAMDRARVVCNADGTPRAGVLRVPSADLLTALGTMEVAIGIAEFATSKSRADGVVIFTNDGTLNVTITAAPVSNSRIDVIWVKHNDDTTGDANALPTAGVTAGTAAASPVKPAIPTGALELGTLRVYAGTTAANGGSNTLTNTYAYTAMSGGAVPFRTKADLDLWTTAQAGQLAIDLATDSIYIRTASAWVTDVSTAVTPSAVTGTGATIVDGDVILTSATGTIAVSIPFTNRFDHYLIELHADTDSSDAGISMQLRTAGAAIATGYIGTYEEIAVGIGRSKVDVNGTSFPCGRIAANGGAVQISVFRPAKVTGNKLFECRSIDGAGYRREAAGYCSGSTGSALGGISILLGGVTVNAGRIRVVGVI